MMRVHVTHDAVARSPRAVQEWCKTGVQALTTTIAMLEPLPQALLSRWLQTEDGHVIINAHRHDFTTEAAAFRGRSLSGVAWVNLQWLLQDPVLYLMPIGVLIAHKIGWGKANQPKNQPWQDFVRGVLSGFEAGYGRHQAALRHPGYYLAEGIAWYLVDSRQLNIENPRLQKLLRRTLFSETWYRWLEAP